MIRVLIERYIVEGHEHYYDSTVRRIISSVQQAPGCISGEALIDQNDRRRRFVMSKWQSAGDWDNWLQSDERRRVLAEITPLLEGSEKITMLETQ